MTPKTAMATGMLGPVRVYSAISSTTPGSDMIASATKPATPSILPR